MPLGMYLGRLVKGGAVSIACAGVRFLHSPACYIVLQLATSAADARYWGTTHAHPLSARFSKYFMHPSAALRSLTSGGSGDGCCNEEQLQEVAPPHTCFPASIFSARRILYCPTVYKSGKLITSCVLPKTQALATARLQLSRT